MRKMAVLLAVLGCVTAGCSERSNDDNSLQWWECANEGTVQLEGGVIESYGSADYDSSTKFASMSGRVQVSGGNRPECALPSEQLLGKVICATDIARPLSEWVAGGQVDEFSYAYEDTYYVGMSVEDFPSPRYCVMGFSGDGGRTWKYATRDGQWLTGSDKAAIGQTAWIRGVDTLISVTQYDADRIGVFGDPATGNRFLLKNGDITVSGSSGNAHLVIGYPVVDDGMLFDHTLVINYGAIPNIEDYEGFLTFDFGSSMDMDCMTIASHVPAYHLTHASTLCGDGWVAGDLAGTYSASFRQANSSSSPHIIAMFPSETGSLLVDNILLRAPQKRRYDERIEIYELEVNSNYETDISIEISDSEQTLKARSAIVEDPEYGYGSKVFLLTGNTNYPSFIELTGLTAGIGRINFRCYDWSTNADGKIKVSTASLEEYIDLSGCRRYSNDGSGGGNRHVMQYVTLDDPLTTYLRIEPIGITAGDGDSRFALGSLSWKSAY
ncbi:MAG: hypothetical protein FWC40_08160 [Proteobacteria bacterium]|nr:hypothetical protein [Pseudomonadota bacterium]